MLLLLVMMIYIKQRHVKADGHNYTNIAIRNNPRTRRPNFIDEEWLQEKRQRYRSHDKHKLMIELEDHLHL